MPFFGIANALEMTPSDLFPFRSRSMLLRVPSPLRRQLIFGLFLAVGCCVAADARAQELDQGVGGTLPEDYLPELKPLIADALTRSPDLIVAELSVEIADAEKLANGVHPLLPSLGASVQYGLNQSAVTDNSGPSSRNLGFTYNANASQPLFQWGALKNQLAGQQIQVAIHEKNYAEAYRIFVGSLRRDYLSLVGQKIGLRNARVFLKLKQDALALATDQLKSGALSAGAIALPQLNAAQAQLGLEEAEQNYLSARRALARKLGRKDLPEEAIPTEVPLLRPFSPSVAQALAAEVLRDGARGIAAVQLQELNHRYWEFQYKFWDVNQLPKISAQAGVNEASQPTVSGNTVNQTFLTSEQFYVVANWNIFDGFFTRGQKRIAMNQKRIAEHQLQTTADTISETVQTAERNLEFAFRQLAITENMTQIVEGELVQTEDSVKRGAAGPSALDTARYTAYINESSLASARSAFLADWADFVSLVGHDPAMRNLPSRYVRQE
jgi:outer membrane protein TolC